MKLYNIKWILIFLISFSLGAQTITSIKVRGNKKIESAVIKKKIDTKVGSKFIRKLIKSDIEKIFSLGFFDDVKVSLNGTRLVYAVEEKPIISKITYIGNDAVDEKDVKEASKLKEYSILNIATLNKAVTDLLKMYEEKGYYLATVKYEVKDVAAEADEDESEKHAEVVFKIAENDKIKIRKISFNGNQNLHDETIKGYLQTKENSAFSWFSGSGNYKENVIDRDREIIRYFYNTKGYAVVEVSPPVTYISPDKKWIYITFNIKEGDKYFFNNVKFAGKGKLFTDLKLREKLMFKKGEVYNFDTLREQITTYQNLYGDLGYAFANIIPRPSYDKKNKTIDIQFEIDKGEKVYFGEINVIGNTKTRDKVIRRELRIHEGELYNRTKKEESKNRVMALGFFDEVKFLQKVPKDGFGKRMNIINLTIKVKERSTGQLMLGMAYSTVGGFGIQVQVSQRNFMGRGQLLSVYAQLDKISSRYMLSFYEPYLFDTEWGAGVDLYRQERQTQVFTTLRTGFDLKVSHPITDYSRLYLMYKLEKSRTTWVESLSNVFNPDVENGTTSSGTVTFEHDKRNNRITPTKGNFESISIEYAGLGGDKYFVKTVMEARYYEPLFWGTTFRSRVGFSNVGALYNKPLPYSERFLGGGVDSLRGFEPYSLGPKAEDVNGTLYPIGGLNEFIYTAELEFPILSEAKIQGVFFFDMGTTFNKISSNFTTDVPMRANWGIGFRWWAPIGPLRFEWGVPIKRLPGENKTVFQFAFLPPF